MTPVRIHKNRSRRLRKKLHLEEFQEFGFQLTFTLKPELASFEEALDRWLAFIESQGWGFGGGGSLSGHEIDGYLCQLAGGTLTESDREQTAQWLTSQPWVASHQIAPLSDAWYGPWEG